MNRETVARIIDEIDHPDSLIRRELMDQLLVLGEDGVEPIIANMQFANKKAQMSLIQVLREIGSEKATLPLMRFVFDIRNEPTAADVRGLTMRAIVALGTDRLAQPLFDFALDLIDDDDAFVRAGCCELLGRFGDARARGILNDRLSDDEIVSEAAQKALLRLDVSQQDGLESHYSDEELLQNIRSESGGQREFFTEEMKRRENAFELAADLVRSRGRGMMVGLNVIQELGDARGRRVATHVLESSRDATQLAVALRLLATYLVGDASEEEAAAIRQCYYHEDRFVQLAAVNAASRSGDADLLQRAVSELVKTKDDETRRLIASGLAKTLPEHTRWAFPKLTEVFRKIAAQKRTPDRQLIQAYLLRSIRHTVDSKGLGVREARAIAFEALTDADGHQPTLISALELLNKTTPAVLAESERWSANDAMTLATYLSDGTANTDERILKLLHFGAPSGLSNLVSMLQPLAFAKDEIVIEYVIPLLAKTGTADGMQTVEDLAQDGREEIRLAAEAALRRRRNSSDFIDAEFE